MTYKALMDFIGVIGGQEVRFQSGQIISAANAKELDLANKPDLAEPTKKGGTDAATA